MPISPRQWRKPNCSGSIRMQTRGSVVGLLWEIIAVKTKAETCNIGQLQENSLNSHLPKGDSRGYLGQAGSQT